MDAKIVALCVLVHEDSSRSFDVLLRQLLESSNLAIEAMTQFLMVLRQLSMASVGKCKE